MGRLNIKKYDPVSESSQGEMAQELANAQGALVIQLDVEPEQANPDRLTCRCGCGVLPAGKKALFMMGHDARLRGKLQRAHLTDTLTIEIVNGKARPPRPAMSVAAEHNWEKYLEAAETAREGKNRQVLRKAMNSKRLVKVGRWEYTGQVVAIYENGEDRYKVEYVTRTGDVKHTTVPAHEAKEV